MRPDARSCGVVPSTELVQFEATDGVPLSGLLYEPRRSAAAIIWLHGISGSVFDARRTNKLGAAFTSRRFAFFPFNNRGAHVIRRGRLGAAYEVLWDCVYDIDGAIRQLRRRGYRDFTLAGHSTGATKIAVYDHSKPRNSLRRYSLRGGADDTGMLHRERGARRLLAQARRKRNSDELVPGRIMSWRAFYDMANPDGDYNVFPFAKATRGRRPFRYIRAIRKPALYVYGEKDEYGFDAELLAENIAANGEIVVIRNADHGFHGNEEELATLIADWIWERGRLAG